MRVFFETLFVMAAKVADIVIVTVIVVATLRYMGVISVN